MAPAHGQARSPAVSHLRCKLASSLPKIEIPSILSGGT